MELKDLHQSKTFRGILIGICTVIIALVIFQMGIFVGERKAAFSYRFNDNYHRNFTGPRRGFGMNLMGDDLPNEHGADGRIVRVSLPTFVVADTDSVEKVVVIDKDTIIRRFQNTVTGSDIKVGDNTVVIGIPNDTGQIVAKLIRLLPSEQEQTTSTSTTLK